MALNIMLYNIMLFELKLILSDYVYEGLLLGQRCSQFVKAWWRQQ